MAIFDKALSLMDGRAFLEPRPFKSYAAEAGFPNEKTVENISVQDIRGLAPELKKAGVMVFRLGNPLGTKGTHFALARHLGGWDDYFLQDEKIFEGREACLANGSNEKLDIFRILPKSTETSLVNLAVASGILQTALDLDHTEIPLINATAQGTYSFEVFPHPNMDAAWNHVDGQVEIDGAFIARRGGVKTMFVVEAKVSDGLESLAKHKIAYPMLAIETMIPKGIPIVGVYLRVVRRISGFDFYVAECTFSSDRHEIASLTVRRTGRYFLQNDKPHAYETSASHD